MCEYFAYIKNWTGSQLRLPHNATTCYSSTDDARYQTCYAGFD